MKRNFLLSCLIGVISVFTFSSFKSRYLSDSEKSKISIDGLKSKKFYPGTYVGSFFDDAYPGGTIYVYVNPTNSALVDGFVPGTSNSYHSASGSYNSSTKYVTSLDGYFVSLGVTYHVTYTGTLNP